MRVDFPAFVYELWVRVVGYELPYISIFPVHGLASLILMSKYARSRHGSSLRGFPDNIIQIERLV